MSKSSRFFSLFTFVLSLLVFNDAFGQIGIGTTSPNSSAILDLSSTTKGFLPPRMTASQRSSISNPTSGLLVYQTDGVTGIYQYNGTSWVQLKDENIEPIRIFTSKTSTQTIPNVTTTTLTGWSTPVLNNAGSSWNATNGTFTAPRDMKVLVASNIVFASHATGTNEYSVRFYVNGNVTSCFAYEFGYNQTRYMPVNGAQGIIDLSSGDVLTVRVLHNSGGNLNIHSNGNSLSIAEINDFK